MADSAALVFALDAKLTKLEKALARAEARTQQAATKIDKQFTAANKNVTVGLAKSASAMSSFGNISNAQRFVIQNTANQFGDLAVQIAGGTSAARALSQQMPQLLGGFGALGGIIGTLAPILGVVAAIGFPLAAAFLAASDGGEDLNKTLEKMAKVSQEAIKATEDAQTPIVELTQKYGDLAAAIYRARAAQAVLAQIKAAGAISLGTQGVARDILGPDLISSSSAGVAALGGDLQALIDQTDQLRDKLMDVARLSPEETALTKQIEINQGYIDTLTAIETSVDDLAQKYGIAADEAQGIVAASIALRDADGVKAQAVAADELQQKLIEVFGSEKDIEDVLPGILSGLAQIVKEAGGLSAVMGSAADEAARLARNFAQAQQRLAADGKVYSGRGGDPRTSNRQGGGFKYTGPALDANNNIKPTKRGGGGASEAEKEHKRNLAEAKALYEATRTAAEKYEIELKKIDDLKAQGLINDETYQRALSDLKDKFEGLGNVGDKVASSLRSAFEGVFDDPKRALENLGKELVKMALYMQLIKSFPSVFGSGGFIPLAGARAGGGPVSAGRAYLVGESGPEIMVPAASGAVIPNHALSSGGRSGGGTIVSIQNYSGSPARAETTKGPDGRDIVRVIVGDEIARGGLDKPMKGRFGASPYAVKR